MAKRRQPLPTQPAPLPPARRRAQTTIAAVRAGEERALDERIRRIAREEIRLARQSAVASLFKGEHSGLRKDAKTLFLSLRPAEREILRRRFADQPEAIAAYDRYEREEAESKIGS